MPIPGALALIQYKPPLLLNPDDVI